MLWRGITPATSRHITVRRKTSLTGRLRVRAWRSYHKQTAGGPQLSHRRTRVRSRKPRDTQANLEGRHVPQYCAFGQRDTCCGLPWYTDWTTCSSILMSSGTEKFNNCSAAIAPICTGRSTGDRAWLCGHHG
eukprot:scaffold4841_cov121-Isochrysis_galbana.AAC.4